MDELNAGEYKTSPLQPFGRQAFYLAGHRNALLSQQIGSLVGRDVLLFRKANHLFHRLIDA